MTDSGTDSTTLTWSVPECPFTIESSARVLDDIRLAVTDAFFSLPRGGAEIGVHTHHLHAYAIARAAGMRPSHQQRPSNT